MWSDLCFRKITNVSVVDCLEWFTFGSKETDSETLPAFQVLESLKKKKKNKTVAEEMKI